MENNQAVGGLRNPYGAIQSKAAAWKVGASVRHVLLGVIKGNTRELHALASGAPFTGFHEDTVEAAASALSSLAGVKLEAPSPIRVTLLESLLNMSHDPEKDVANWLREGFPLGIEKELGVNKQRIPSDRGGYKSCGTIKTVPTAYRLVRCRPSRKLQVLPGGRASSSRRIGASGRSGLCNTRREGA